MKCNVRMMVSCSTAMGTHMMIRGDGGIVGCVKAGLAKAKAKTAVLPITAIQRPKIELAL